MKEITIDVLKDAANRLLFSMSDEEYQTLLEEFKTISLQMEKMDGIKDLNDVEPMTFPFPCETSFLREDIAETPLNREKALANAGSKMDNQIKLPKVVI